MRYNEIAAASVGNKSSEISVLFHVRPDDMPLLSNLLLELDIRLLNPIRWMPGEKNAFVHIGCRSAKVASALRAKWAASGKSSV